MIARTARTLPCYKPFDGFCDACGGAEYAIEQTHLGHLCTECRVECPYCENWLLAEATTTLDGNAYHAECAAEFGALADALVQELMPDAGDLVIMAHYSDQIGGAA